MTIGNNILIDNKTSLLFCINTTLYVGGNGPDNYTKIQDAIYNASNGDTVFVFDDSSPYKELLVINKCINLIGENRDTTIIDGNFEDNDIIIISADSVKLRGFTIQHSGEDIHNPYYAISLTSNNCFITDNNFINNDRGIISLSTDNNIIQNNTFSNNNDVAIRIYKSINNKINNNSIISNYLYISESNSNIISNNSISEGSIYLIRSDKENTIISNNVSNSKSSAFLISGNSNDNIICNNYISNSPQGIRIYDGAINNIITKNIIINNQQGITLKICEKNLLKNNIISHNNKGIQFVMNGQARENTITQNTISNNEYGIKFESQSFNPSYKNEITINNLIDNQINTYDSIPLGFYILGYKNIWDNNYYSNYKGGLLHIIPCELRIYIILPLPFFSIDWNPASEPFDI